LTKNLTKFSKKQWLIFAAALVLIIAFSATTVYFWKSFATSYRFSRLPGDET